MGSTGVEKVSNHRNVYSYGEELTNFMDYFCAFLLALSPIMQHYVGIYENAGFSILLFILPWILFRGLYRIKRPIKINHLFFSIIPLLFYYLYSMVAHGITLVKVLYNGYLIVFILLLTLKCINTSFVLKVAIKVCELASFILVVQYICFYILGFHLKIVPTDLLLEESSAWILLAETGLYNIRGGFNGFYRPSAFFLEPSHFALYSIPCVCMLLLSKSFEKERIKKSVLITMGIILSTSGLGFAICVLIWGIYLFFYNGKSYVNKKLLLVSYKKIIWGTLFIVLLLGLYLSVETVSNTVNRIFSEEGGSSAIGGRMNQASLLINSLTGNAVLFGLTDDTSDIIFNMPGFFATFYKKGIIGLLLSYYFYCSCMFKTKGRYFWLSLIIVLLSFFTAHTHGTFYMLYFIMLLIGGYDEKGRDLEIGT